MSLYGCISITFEVEFVGILQKPLLQAQIRELEKRGRVEIWISMCAEATRKGAGFLEQHFICKAKIGIFCDYQMVHYFYIQRGSRKLQLFSDVFICFAWRGISRRVVVA
mgnify:CR=1 FL=1